MGRNTAVRLSKQELPRGEARVVAIAGQPVAIFSLGDEFVAVQSHCPHQGAPLEAGLLLGATLICPWHGWRFNLRDGTCETRTHCRLRKYSIVDHGAEIEVGN